MPEIILRLFGFIRASQFDSETRTLAQGITVRDLWEDLRSAAEPDSLLAKLPPEKVLALLNGHPLNRPEKWDQVVTDGDTITYMVLALGG